MEASGFFFCSCCLFLFFFQPYFLISHLKQEEKKRWDLKHSHQSLQSGFCVLGAPASFARFLKPCGIWNSRQLRAAYAQWCVHDQDRPIRPRWQNLPARRKWQGGLWGIHLPISDFSQPSLWPPHVQSLTLPPCCWGLHPDLLGNPRKVSSEHQMNLGSLVFHITHPSRHSQPESSYASGNTPGINQINSTSVPSLKGPYVSHQKWL